MSQYERLRDEKPNPPWAHLRLPPFPQVALRVMQLANNENVQLHQLSELLGAPDQCGATAGEVSGAATSC